MCKKSLLEENQMNTPEEQKIIDQATWNNIPKTEEFKWENIVPELSAQDIIDEVVAEMEAKN